MQEALLRPSNLHALFVFMVINWAAAVERELTMLLLPIGQLVDKEGSNQLDEQSREDVSQENRLRRKKLCE